MFACGLVEITVIPYNDAGQSASFSLSCTVRECSLSTIMQNLVISETAFQTTVLRRDSPAAAG